MVKIATLKGDQEKVQGWSDGEFYDQQYEGGRQVLPIDGICCTFKLIWDATNSMIYDRITSGFKATALYRVWTQRAAPSQSSPAAATTWFPSAVVQRFTQDRRTRCSSTTTSRKLRRVDGWLTIGPEIKNSELVVFIIKPLHTQGKRKTKLCFHWPRIKNILRQRSQSGEIHSGLEFNKKKCFLFFCRYFTFWHRTPLICGWPKLVVNWVFDTTLCVSEQEQSNRIVNIIFRMK